MDSQKRLILIRHAHRDLSLGRSRDNGISAKGKAQVKAIKKYFKFLFPKEKAVLFTSPKRRCVETIEDLPRKPGTELHEWDLLLEQGESEKFSGLKKRVGTFIKWWEKEAPDLVVACSHGDWIPLFFLEIFGEPLPLKKGGWAEIELLNGKPILNSLIQKLPV